MGGNKRFAISNHLGYNWRTIKRGLHRGWVNNGLAINRISMRVGQVAIMIYARWARGRRGLNTSPLIALEWPKAAIRAHGRINKKTSSFLVQSPPSDRGKMLIYVHLRQKRADFSFLYNCITVFDSLLKVATGGAWAVSYTHLTLPTSR